MYKCTGILIKTDLRHFYFFSEIFFCWFNEKLNFHVLDLRPKNLEGFIQYFEKKIKAI